jgi:TRAP-type C4-dicarboxylate transport system permease small subunit
MDSSMHLIDRAARGLALIAGLVLVSIALVTVVSIAMRAGLNRPLTGDIEIVELLAAAAVFGFFPYCQSRHSNLRVRLFTDQMNVRTQAILQVVEIATYAVVMSVIAWRMILGGLDVRETGEVSMMIELPRWWGYVFGSFFVSFAAFVGLMQTVQAMWGLRR